MVQNEKRFHYFESALDIISNSLFQYPFIHSHSYLFGQASASVACIIYFQQQAKHRFLFVCSFL